MTGLVDARLTLRNTAVRLRKEAKTERGRLPEVKRWAGASNATPAVKRAHGELVHAITDIADSLDWHADANDMGAEALELLMSLAKTGPLAQPSDAINVLTNLVRDAGAVLRGEPCPVRVPPMSTFVAAGVVGRSAEALPVGSDDGGVIITIPGGGGPILTLNVFHDWRRSGDLSNLTVTFVGGGEQVIHAATCNAVHPSLYGDLCAYYHERCGAGEPAGNLVPRQMGQGGSVVWLPEDFSAPYVAPAAGTD